MEFIQKIITKQHNHMYYGITTEWKVGSKNTTIVIRAAVYFM